MIHLIKGNVLFDDYQLTFHKLNMYINYYENVFYCPLNKLYSLHPTFKQRSCAGWKVMRVWIYDVGLLTRGKPFAICALNKIKRQKLVASKYIAYVMYMTYIGLVCCWSRRSYFGEDEVGLSDCMVTGGGTATANTICCISFLHLLVQYYTVVPLQIWDFEPYINAVQNQTNKKCTM